MSRSTEWDRAQVALLGAMHDYLVERVRISQQVADNEQVSLAGRAIASDRAQAFDEVVNFVRGYTQACVRIAPELEQDDRVRIILGKQS